MGKTGRGKENKTLARTVCASGVLPYLAAVVLFFAVCLGALSTAKGTAMLLLAATLVVGIVRIKHLSARIGWPLVALFAVVAMDFLSTFYAAAGKFALTEFLKIVGAFCVALLLLALTPAQESAPGSWIAGMLARAAALMGLVSIDLLSTHWLSGAVVRILQLFGTDFAFLLGVEDGIRMTSMIRNPNVFAGVAGIGVLLSLGLAASCKQGKTRRSHLVCLFINALSFVLAFSMGATAMIAAAFLVYLLLEQAHKRAGLLVLMVETLIVTVAAVIPIAATSFGIWRGLQPVPMLCVVCGGVMLCLLDRFAGQPLSDKLAGHGRAVLAGIAGILAAVLAFSVAAYHLTGATELAAGESLHRSIYPQPGLYTVSAQTSAPVTVVIESQNREQTMMHTRTQLYRGDLAQAEFDVAEDCLVVYMTFTAREDTRLSQVVWSGERDEGEVPLGYKLLPGFIANRIQGLFANQNAIQRTVFFEDGIKLFLRSPVFGCGIGGYESGLMSVQRFYYETKYAHNHYIQVMVETGVVGLILFAGLLIACAAAVLRCRRRKPDAALTACLGAALVFMAGHGGVEVVFSHYAYLPFAFGVFALINLCCAAPVSGRGVRTGAAAGIALVLVAFFVLLGGNLRARRLFGMEMLSFTDLEQAVRLDRYERADYMLSYISAAPNAPDNPQIQERAAQYAEELAGVDSKTIPTYLADYYFANGDTERGFAMVEKYVRYAASGAQTWQWAFDTLERYELDSQFFRDGVAHIVELMDRWNEENMGQITLTPGNRAFLQRIGV